MSAQESGFVAAWTRARTGPSAQLDDLAATVMAHKGRRLQAPDGLFIGVFGPTPPTLRRSGARDVVLGELFEAPPSFVPAGARLMGDEEADGSARARMLLRRTWGAYVALFAEAAGWSVLRDPSGGLEAFVWEAKDLDLVASSLRLPLGLWRPRPRLDEDRLGALVADPGRATGALALTGVAAPAPGTLRFAEGRELALWTPAAVARAGSLELEAAPESLSATVGGCVGAWGSVLKAPIVEVSGGLDSAIVTAALGEAARRRAAAFVNHVVVEPGADERPYARAVADLWGVTLIERLKPEIALDPDALAKTADAARPSFNATDEEYDAGVARMIAQRGADAVVTGQGGDAVFLTLRSPWLAADLLRRRGPAGVADPEFLALARRLQTSIWSLVGHASLGLMRLGGRPSRPLNRFASAAACRQARRLAPHPWLADLHGCAPARRLQIVGLTDALAFQGDSLRARRARLVHPLLSQPLLEVCLAIPPDVLVRGGRDRGLARDVFASRLPALVAQRRGKGDMTAYYGRMLARSLVPIRPFLLEGRLAAGGWLDVDALGAALTPERLAADGGYADLMDLSAIEAWARHWSSGSSD